MKFAFGVLALAVSAGSAFAADISLVNGTVMQNRVWNDFASSTLVSTNNYPAQVSWDESFPAGTTGNFANKHLAYLSTDGGATPLGLNVGQSWTLTTNIQISAPNASPRKEGALQIENPRPGLGYTDEGHVLVASDGEVAIFGGVMPFYTSNFTGGPWYSLNSISTLTLEYFAPGSNPMDPILGGLRVSMNDPVHGFHQSPILTWGSMEPDGTKGFNTGTKIAFQAQNQRNPFIDDHSFISYTGTTIVPAPGALALMGLAGLAAARRRR